MKVLIVDNFDSFTYNLKHYIIRFCPETDVVRYNKLRLGDLNIYDKILFSPGPGIPNEYPNLAKIIKEYGGFKSILGVCLGQQAIAEFYGAKLENLDEPMHGVISKIHHLNNCTLFNHIPPTFNVGHYHSWVISDSNMPKELEITSLNDNGLVMSIKHKIHDIKAIQFHPESILTEHGFQLIENWIHS